MGLRDVPLTTIDGKETSLAEYSDQVVMVVNVASRCGQTPQYETLEHLQKEYGDRGFTVIGFPSNQFLQELSSEEAIQEFCAVNYGVTFPLMKKIRVNGRKRHPLYALLTKFKDASGKAGKVTWNFEKFVITPNGKVSRFRSGTWPNEPAVIAAIEDGLASAEPKSA
jgi:glutathione peroxidase